MNHPCRKPASAVDTHWGLTRQRNGVFGTLNSPKTKRLASESSRLTSLTEPISSRSLFSGFPLTGIGQAAEAESCGSARFAIAITDQLTLK